MGLIKVKIELTNHDSTKGKTAVTTEVLVNTQDSNYFNEQKILHRLSDILDTFIELYESNSSRNQRC